MFRPKSGLSLRRRWLLLKTLCTNEAQLPQKINKGCQKKLLIFCKSLLKGNKILLRTTFLYQRFESDDEESEEEEKILDKHEKPEPLSAFIHSTRSVSIINFIHISSIKCFQEDVPPAVCLRSETRGEDSAWDNYKSRFTIPVNVSTYYLGGGVSFA